MIKVFEDHNDGMAYMRSHKPPAGMKWAIEHIETGENEDSDAVRVYAIERWPINPDGPLNKPDKWTLESGDPLP